MNCTEYLSRLDATSSETLDAETSSLLEHLQSCSSCQAEFDRTEAEVRALLSTPQMRTPEAIERLSTALGFEVSGLRVGSRTEES